LFQGWLFRMTVLNVITKKRSREGSMKNGAFI
jgi:hypothetical protein